MATLLQVRDILRERGKYNPDLATQLLLVVIIMAIFLLHTYDYTYYFVCHSLANLVSGSCRVRVQDQGGSGVYLDLL